MWAHIGITEAADPANAPGVSVATRGDFRGHQQGPQLAITESFLVAMGTAPPRQRTIRCRARMVSVRSHDPDSTHVSR
jgi:hypothetical protein